MGRSFTAPDRPDATVIKRPAVQPDVRPVAALLERTASGSHGNACTQAHERPEPKFIRVTMVRFDVIADRRRLDDAAFEAERAQRVS